MVLLFCFIIYLGVISGNAAVPQCADQTRSKDTCRGRYPSVSSTCWLFQSCVKHECKRQRGIMVGNCFNGVCESEENVDNCPADCCPEKKNSICSLFYEQCPLICCGVSNCCGKEDSDGDGESKNSGMLATCIVCVVLMLVICVEIVLVRRHCPNKNEVRSFNSQ